jgi:FkbM family methyltransferase
MKSKVILVFTALKKRAIRAQHQAIFFYNLNGKYKFQFLRYLFKFKSQLGQDIFCLSVLNFKKQGFFVEFGATNGVNLSNSFVLEKNFGWSGVLSEPAKKWQPILIKNRSAKIDFRCVWSETGREIEFSEIQDAAFSTITILSDSDLHSVKRKKELSCTYAVETVSLEDLLISAQAPKVIDYLSIDTEGSEFQILEHFNFSNFQFHVITVEHNYTDSRDRIQELLKANSYTRVLEKISLWDDWYIHNDILPKVEKLVQLKNNRKVNNW